ncbi:AMP-binding protein [Pseudonocardia hydrocarbonoxydans]|uniref:AMP-dependent synthetase n=1 Tax=Pseudonocardia hydrocarbonoxydans TaxID=76726 RepID=A0A4Y3WRA9_9PSEU|nr:AMP-binding protein [Pseudonocardia hydrocarbonoxydans]GEC21422.1 AMP-dependent synthetase [Pseudonocardia hydrocarbonoxydans]
MSTFPVVGEPSLAAMLSAHGERTALVTSDGEPVSHRDLADRVHVTADRLAGARRLVLLEAANDVDTVVTYLAALRAGHPVLLAGAGDGFAALARHYDPDVVAARRDGGWVLDERRRTTVHELHRDLAVLLSTSGSTGSPKLVRLSHANIASNAAAIAGYLGIRDSDRAALTLPLHYCYGLSVLHSNLLRGAAVLLPDRSVTDPGFFPWFRDQGGTSLHGVPYTFELLDRIGFADLRLPALRYVTQAGGRLDPRTVVRYAELGDRQGWELFVMYGQTEATARMAYLPPALAVTAPSAVGIPIAGGSFEIERPDAGGVGELLYRGPNVMLGYARVPADLARGRDLDVLRTGDLARVRPDGLHEIVGRRSRIVKPFGLRIDLEQLERLLAGDGRTAACAGVGDELVVVVADGADPGQVREWVSARTGLPPGAVRVVAVPELPRRPNGKIDHGAVRELAAAPPERRRGWRARARPRTVRDAFRAVFALPDPPDDATFVGLGGDSLRYVQMTVELQRVLGHLPPGWDDVPIGVLERLPRHRRFWTTTETGVLLRAAAIVLVVGSHVGLFEVKGGAHLLLGITGWAFARFVLARRPGGGTSRAILRGVLGVAVPSMLWIAWRARSDEDVDPVNALLLNQFLDPGAWGYWYVEVVVQISLLLAVLFAIPAVRRAEQARGFGFAVALLALALVGRLFPDTGNEFSDRLMSTHLVLWLFVLGWVVQRSSTGPRRLLAAALILVLVPGFFDDPGRAAVVTAGLLVLLLVPRIALPTVLMRPVGAIAAASLAIYLTHYAVYPELLPYLPPLLVVVACVGVGVGVRVALTACRRAVRPLTGAATAPPAAG